MTNKKLKIVVIGGGTGSFVVLSGLRKYNFDLTAVVNVADSGGSTGRLRTEFGFLPVGDMRQCLAALASDNNIKKILLYRFNKGKGLVGHNLGNLILTALTDIVSSEPKAIEIAARIFRLKGKILPITTKNIQLKAIYKDNTVITGQHEIDEPIHIGGKQIIKLETVPRARIYKNSYQAIKMADIIILGPGDLYTSILPNLIINGVKQAFQESKAKIIYIVNLMTRFSQTDKFTAKDHVGEIEKYIGKKLNYVLINTGKIPKKINNIYKKEKSFKVLDDLGNNNYFKIIRKDFVAPSLIVRNKADVLHRSYLRHDSNKLAKTIISLV